MFYSILFYSDNQQREVRIGVGMGRDRPLDKSFHRPSNPPATSIMSYFKVLGLPLSILRVQYLFSFWSW